MVGLWGKGDRVGGTKADEGGVSRRVRHVSAAGLKKYRKNTRKRGEFLIAGQLNAHRRSTRYVLVAHRDQSSLQGNRKKQMKQRAILSSREVLPAASMKHP